MCTRRWECVSVIKVIHYSHGEMGAREQFCVAPSLRQVPHKILEVLSHYILKTTRKMIPSPFIGKECEAQ